MTNDEKNQIIDAMRSGDDARSYFVGNSKMRLSLLGVATLRSRCKSWVHDLHVSLTYGHILYLSKNSKYPFYLDVDHSYIETFDEDLSFILSLTGGGIEDVIKSGYKI